MVFSLMNRAVFGFAQVYTTSVVFRSLKGLVLSAQTLLLFSHLMVASQAKQI